MRNKLVEKFNFGIRTEQLMENINVEVDDIKTYMINIYSVGDVRLAVDSKHATCIQLRIPDTWWSSWMNPLQSSYIYM